MCKVTLTNSSIVLYTIFFYTYFGIQDEEESDSDEVQSVVTERNLAEDQRVDNGRSWFTLKDVEGSVSSFSGTGSPDVEQWIDR